MIPLQPTQTRHERILLYGPPGSGKSTAWRAILDWIYRTKSDAHAYILDTDRAWEAQRPNDNHLDHIVRLPENDQDGYVSEYNDVKKWLVHCKQEGRRQDWLIVDMVDRIWTQFVPTHFFEEAYGRDIDEFFIQARQKDENIGGSWGVNWNSINVMYNKVFGCIKDFPGHVLACTSAKEIRQDEDDGDILRLFGGVGQQPAGQKDLPYAFHTILLMQQSRFEPYVMSTTKERESLEQPREKLKLTPVKPDFVMSYLVKVGKWQIMDKKDDDSGSGGDNGDGS